MEQAPLLPEVLADRAAPNNGKGRPPGARGIKHRTLERALRGDILPIIRKVAEQAKDGDMFAARILLDRFWPRPKLPFVHLDLPETRTPAELRAAMHQLLGRVSRGELTPDAGAAAVQIMRDILDAHRVATFGDDPAANSTEAATRDLLITRLTRAIADRQSAAAPPAEESAAPGSAE